MGNVIYIWNWNLYRVRVFFQPNFLQIISVKLFLYTRVVKLLAFVRHHVWNSKKDHSIYFVAHTHINVSNLVWKVWQNTRKWYIFTLIEKYNTYHKTKDYRCVLGSNTSIVKWIKLEIKPCNSNNGYNPIIFIVTSFVETTIQKNMLSVWRITEGVFEGLSTGERGRYCTSNEFLGGRS